ncbi:MAG TPA: peptidase, partial [Thermoanaerobaculia bacterium]|nr:peptidase [Thermoanaerobaculia bacterium]
DGDVKRGNLSGRFDVILFPETGGSFAELVHGIDPKYGPLAYTKTAEFPSHGVPDASDDITGGMGFAGLLEIQRFVRGGGVLVTLGNAGVLPVEGGLLREVARVPPGGFYTPGSELRAKVLRPEHPIAYGYEALPSVFRGNGPLFDVDKRNRNLVVLQFGTKKEEKDEEPEAPAEKPEVEVEEVVDPGADPAMAPEAPPAPKPAEEKKKPEEDSRLVLSGFVRGEDVVNGKPAILDVPAGKGRVVLFAFNPLHRYLTHSDFRLVWNVFLNWNDLP